MPKVGYLGTYAEASFDWTQTERESDFGERRSRAQLEQKGCTEALACCCFCSGPSSGMGSTFPHFVLWRCRMQKFLRQYFHAPNHGKDGGDFVTVFEISKQGQKTGAKRDQAATSGSEART